MKIPPVKNRKKRLNTETKNTFKIGISDMGETILKSLSNEEFALKIRKKSGFIEEIKKLVFNKNESGEIKQQIDYLIKTKLSEIAKSINSKSIKSPSFIDFEKKEGQDYYFCKFNDSLDIILLLVLKSIYFYNEEQDVRKSLNDLFLAELLLSKLANVLKKTSFFKPKSNLSFVYKNISPQTGNNIINFLKATIYFILGSIYFDQFAFDESYKYFCSVIKIKENIKTNVYLRYPENQSNEKKYSRKFSEKTINFIYKSSLLSKGKLCIEFGRIPEATKWLAKAIYEISPNKNNLKSLEQYENYINSISDDDVIDKEYLIQDRLGSFLDEVKFFDNDFPANSTFCADVAIRLIYCIFILRPAIIKGDTRNTAWSKGITTLNLFLKLPTSLKIIL